MLEWVFDFYCHYFLSAADSSSFKKIQKEKTVEWLFMEDFKVLWRINGKIAIKSLHINLVPNTKSDHFFLAAIFTKLQYDEFYKGKNVKSGEINIKREKCISCPLTIRLCIYFFWNICISHKFPKPLVKITVCLKMITRHLVMNFIRIKTSN